MIHFSTKAGLPRNPRERRQRRQAGHSGSALSTWTMVGFRADVQWGWWV